MHLFFLFFLTAFAFAHQTALTSKGNVVRWTSKSIPLMISNSSNDFSFTTSQSIIQNAISEWNSSSSTKIAQQSSAENQIVFTSDFSAYGSAVIGVTEVNYNSAGVASKAIIRLNDNYTFQSSPGFYTGADVYLGDVITHELGHFLGLSHSEVLNSTMFYSAFSGQSSLASDDRSGVRAKYDTGYGKIYGYVKGGNSIGILGVHVQAISRKSGEVISTVSDEDGFFNISGLDLGDTYYLYTSPLKNLDALPLSFTNTKNNFCPASYVGGFFTACGNEKDGFPQGINLTSTEPEVYVGTVTINCSLKTNDDYSYQKVQSTFAPVNIYDYGVDQRKEKAFVGYFLRPTGTGWSTADALVIDLSDYATSGTQKYLKIAFHGQIFGNQLQYTMTTKQNGVTLSSNSTAMTYVASTETYQADMSTYVPLSSTSSQNVFEIDLSAKKLTTLQLAQTIPSSSLFSSIDYLPYLVVASISEYSGGGLNPVLDTGSSLSDNSSCLDAPLAYKVSEYVSSQDDSTDRSKSAANATGCGTVGPPDDSGPGSGLLLLTVGFLLSLVAGTAIKSTKKFLS